MVLMRSEGKLSKPLKFSTQDRKLIAARDKFARGHLEATLSSGLGTDMRNAGLISSNESKIPSELLTYSIMSCRVRAEHDKLMAFEKLSLCFAFQKLFLIILLQDPTKIPLCRINLQIKASNHGINILGGIATGNATSATSHAIRYGSAYEVSKEL
jgi:hypothetical protein